MKQRFKKHRFRFIQVFILLLLLLPTQLVYLPSQAVQAAGNTYYVAKNGSDSNPGTQVQPWLTIQKAARTLVAGDTVYVRAGTYNEKVVPANSGTSGSYITYKVYPGDTVTIDGTGLSFSYDGLFSINGHSYIEVNGFKIIKSPSGGVMVYGASNYVVLRNLTIGGSLANRCIWSGIHALYDWNEPPARAITNLLIDSCDVSYTNYNAYDEGISLRYCTNFEIKNCTVHDILGDDSRVMNYNIKEAICTKLGTSNGSIHDNTVYNAKVGIYVGGGSPTPSGVSVYSNNVYSCGADGVGGAGIALGAENSGEGLTGFSIYNNLIHDNLYAGFQTGYATGTENFTLINNTFYNNGTERGYWDIRIQTAPTFSGCIIRNNIIYDTNSSNTLLSCSKSGVTIDHNLFYSGAGYYGTNLGSSYIQANPQMTNPSAEDFSITAGSPAQDAGSSTSAPSADYIGTSRPQGSGYDIGAYEYAGGSPNPAAVNTPSALPPVSVPQINAGNNTSQTPVNTPSSLPPVSVPPINAGNNTSQTPVNTPSSLPSTSGEIGGNISLPPPQIFVKLNGFISTDTLIIDPQGFTKTLAQLHSTEGNITLNVAQGTKLYDSKGQPLKTLSASVTDSKSESPSDSAILSNVILGPDEARFDPNLVLTLKYDNRALPVGASEDSIYIAYWDGSKWINLDYQIDTESGTASAMISHFSQYALLAKIAPPAEFTISNLLAIQSAPNIDDLVVVQANVSNTGGKSGSVFVTLRLNGVNEENREVTLSSGQSEIVTFQIKANVPGVYTFDINGKYGQFTIPEPELKPELLSTTSEAIKTLSANEITGLDNSLKDTKTAESELSWPLMWIITGITGIVFIALAGWKYKSEFNRQPVGNSSLAGQMKSRGIETPITRSFIEAWLETTKHNNWITNAIKQIIKR